MKLRVVFESDSRNLYYIILTWDIYLCDFAKKVPAKFSLEQASAAGKNQGACCLAWSTEIPPDQDLSVGEWLTCFV